MFPTDDNSTPPVDQLLGVNDRDVAVGFYTDGEGNNHGFTYSIGRHRHRFQEVTVSGATSVTATAINNSGDIAGFDSDAQGNVASSCSLAGVRPRSPSRARPRPRHSASTTATRSSASTPTRT